MTIDCMNLNYAEGAGIEPVIEMKCRLSMEHQLKNTNLIKPFQQGKPALHSTTFERHGLGGNSCQEQ